MYREVDIYGGELPYTEEITRMDEIPIVFRVVNNIFSILPSSRERMPSYGVQFNPTDFRSRGINSQYLKNEIGKYKSIKLYEVDGKVIFNIRNSSGGLMTNQIFYLIKA